MKNFEKSKTTAKILKQEGNIQSEISDVLAVEEPLEIRLGYTDQRKGRVHKSISITMRTPGNDQELAIGFLYSESIIASMAQIDSIDLSQENIIRLELQENISLDLGRLERHFYTTSSCGVCGKASLEALSIIGAEALVDRTFKIPKPALYSLGEALREKQFLFRETGGNHAAATFNSDGEILLLREDVGRHNAMDKLIGKMLADEVLPMTQSGILVSGRSSFELMQKALMAHCPMLVSVGAPSSLAVELAQEYNIALVGFLSDNSFNIYHGADSIV